MVARREFISAMVASAVSVTALPSLAASDTDKVSFPKNANAQAPFTPPYGLALGGVPLASGFKITPLEDGIDAVRTAWQQGIRYFDTSPWYGQGRSERRMGAFLAEQNRDEFFLSTKIGRLLKPGNPPQSKVWPKPAPFHREYDFSAAGVRRSIEDSMQRLGVDRIDFVFIHDLSPDNGDMGSDWLEYFKQAQHGAMPELIRMREEGIIKGWGLGVNTLAPILKTLEVSDADLFLSATQYTLIRHQDSLAQLHPALRNHGKKMVVGSPLNCGFLSGAERLDYGGTITPELRAKRQQLQAMAQHYGTNLRTVALQFAGAPDVVTSVIVGARNGQQIAEDIASMQQQLPAELWQELKSTGLIAAEAPVPIIS